MDLGKQHFYFLISFCGAHGQRCPCGTVAATFSNRCNRTAICNLPSNVNCVHLTHASGQTATQAEQRCSPRRSRGFQHRFPGKWPNSPHRNAVPWTKGREGSAGTTPRSRTFRQWRKRLYSASRCGFRLCMAGSNWEVTGPQALLPECWHRWP